MQRAINFLAGSSASRIDRVFNGLAVFKDDFSQVALVVVGVAGGLAGYGVGLARQIACGVVRVAVALPRQQLVFVVVFGDGGAVLADAVAIGVIAPGGGNPIHRRTAQAPCGVVAVALGAEVVQQRFLRAGYAAQRIARVAVAEGGQPVGAAGLPGVQRGVYLLNQALCLAVDVGRVVGGGHASEVLAGVDEVAWACVEVLNEVLQLAAYVCWRAVGVKAQ